MARYVGQHLILKKYFNKLRKNYGVYMEYGKYKTRLSVTTCDEND